MQLSFSRSWPRQARLPLGVRVWLLYFLVQVGLRRRSLAEEIARGRRPCAGRDWIRASALGQAVHQLLRIGPFRPRCLITSLILCRLLWDRGDAAQLVIGLPPDAASRRAHAWVEVDGVDVGPPPGRGCCLELARFG